MATRKTLKVTTEITSKGQNANEVKSSSANGSYNLIFESLKMHNAKFDSIDVKIHRILKNYKCMQKRYKSLYTAMNASNPVPIPTTCRKSSVKDCTGYNNEKDTIISNKILKYTFVHRYQWGSKLSSSTNTAEISAQTEFDEKREKRHSTLDNMPDASTAPTSYNKSNSVSNSKEPNIDSSEEKHKNLVKHKALEALENINDIFDKMDLNKFKKEKDSNREQFNKILTELKGEKGEEKIKEEPKIETRKKSKEGNQIKQGRKECKSLQHNQRTETRQGLRLRKPNEHRKYKQTNYWYDHYYY